MYLTSSRPDIMFAICAYARFQVNPKNSHLHAVKRIFRYLKGQPKLGLWYPKDSPFDLVAYTDSYYAGASLDKKSITGAEYIATSNCCGQVLWIQNQLLDYGYNFMQTKIHIDNESTICIVKNLVFHSKTKHIEIRHPFIRDSNEKNLIQMIKIHIDQNVVDLLTKAFDVRRFQYLIIQAQVDKKKVIITKTSKRRDLQLADENSTECLPNATIFAELERIGPKTTAWNEFSSTMASTIICSTQKEGEGLAMPIYPQNTPTISQPSTSQPQKKQPKRKQRKDTEFKEESQAVAKEKKKVKQLQKKRRSRTPVLKRLRKVGSTRRVESSDEVILGAQEDASKQGRKITNLDVDAEVTLVDETQGRNDDNLITTNYNSVFTRLQARGVVVQEPSEFTTTTSPSQPSQLPHAKDKGKAKMIEPEKPLKRKDQIMIDEEIALNLQA
ncbi:hypothetical protein Tco_0574139 [Tanacetum coccineum]